MTEKWAHDGQGTVLYEDWSLSVWAMDLMLIDQNFIFLLYKGTISYVIL